LFDIETEFSSDNPACEGFFGRTKNEFYYGKIWTDISLKEFIVLINDYIITVQ